MKWRRKDGKKIRRFYNEPLVRIEKNLGLKGDAFPFSRLFRMLIIRGLGARNEHKSECNNKTVIQLSNHKISICIFRVHFWSSFEIFSIQTNPAINMHLEWTEEEKKQQKLHSFRFRITNTNFTWTGNTSNARNSRPTKKCKIKSTQKTAKKKQNCRKKE